MNPTDNELKDSAMRLLPHQVALVEAVFNPASKRVILLRGDVGLGKSAALVAVASRVLRERPTARVLLLAPAALQVQFIEMLRDAGTPALCVDRYQFREMLDSAPGEELWPAGVVAVLSREFARQADIRDALATVRWDLLIVDEAHRFRGPLARDVVRQVGESADRIILATIPNLELPDAFPEDSATVVEWRRDQVVDHEGVPIESIPRPILHEVSFSLSPSELSLAESIGELCRELESDTPPRGWVAALLRRSLQSSPAALESALPRLAEARNRIVYGMESADEDSLEDEFAGLLDAHKTKKLGDIAARASGQIEAISRDSKLEAFVGLLRRIEAAQKPSTRICVLTEYLGTLFYLAAEIESQGQTCHVFHGTMSGESRRSTLDLFANAGGILTASSAALQGIELFFVTDLVLYDVPANAALQVVLSRFDRFGRQTPLNIYALVPTGGPEGFVPESLDLLRQVLGRPRPQAGV